MSGKRSAPKEDPEAKAPMWVVTYGDLVSLLVTFFVLIFTFSSMDPDKSRRVRGALIGGFGVMTDDKEKSRTSDVQRNVPMNHETHPEGQKDFSARQTYEELKGDLDTRIQDPNVFNQVVRLAEYPDGVRISIQADRLFTVGGWNVTGTAEEVLREVGRFFAGERVDLVIEAHTDNEMHEWVPDLDAIGLTRRWALGAASVLIQETGWQPARIGVAPMGDMRPLNANATPLERQTNRRIDILVLPHNRGK